MAAAFFPRKIRVRGLLCLCLAAGPALGSEATLAAAEAASGPRLQDNPFGRPLYIDSQEGAGSLRGDVYARLEQPFARVSEALRQPAQWCELLLLPFNVKQCGAYAGADGQNLALNIGRKFDQPLADTHRLVFAYRPLQASARYLEVELLAPEGPVGTRDYRIRFEAMPAGEGQTFLHLGYSYGFGWTGKVAAQAYFATSGRNKIGFTRSGDGVVGGLRGAVERNAMRYFLAIEAYLQSFEGPPAQRFERSLAHWFEATERYPAQLHEMERAEYLEMKRKEHLRQRAAAG